MLTLCDDQSLWIGASGAYVVESNTELFGFGSGDFVKGSESKDVMSDVSADGRWLLYAFTRAQQPVILEKTRQAPSHLESHTFWNQASWKKSKKTVWATIPSYTQMVSQKNSPKTF